MTRKQDSSGTQQTMPKAGSGAQSTLSLIKRADTAPGHHHLRQGGQTPSRNLHPREADRHVRVLMGVPMVTKKENVVRPLKAMLAEAVIIGLPQACVRVCQIKYTLIGANIDSFSPTSARS